MRILVTVALMATLGLAACTQKAEVKEAPPTPVTTPSGPAPNSLAYFASVVGAKVYFATDQHTLSDAAMATLNRQAQWLQANPGTTAKIEGHADERGTRQYNLALGARRANSVRAYLIGKGVAPARVTAVTYGKERPEALCSDESCWSQNRRGFTNVQGAAGS